MNQSWLHRFLRSGLFLICLAAVLALIGIGLGRELLRDRSIEKQIASLQAEAKRLEGRNTELLELSTKLKDPEFVEREARTRFGLQKPGESVIVVRTPTSSPATPPSVAISNLKAWWLYFFNHEAFLKIERTL